MNSAKVAATVAAVAVASVMLSSPARADEDSYLDALSGQGFQVMWQSRPFLISAGQGMCNDLRNGETPEQVAGHWNYPNATPVNLLAMATAAKSHLCPS